MRRRPPATHRLALQRGGQEEGGRIITKDDAGGSARPGGIAAIPPPPVSDFLDASRWIAALLVAAGHARQLLMADFNRVAHPTLPLKALYFATQLGREAVMVFFVVSGYLIGGRALIRLRAGGFDLRHYATHRIARIYTVLVPALLLGGGLDLLGRHLFGATGLYTRQLAISSMAHPAAEALGPGAFIGNLAILQTIAVPPLGTNGPLWSLANEWWYYLLFGAAMIALTASALWARAAAVAMLILAGLLLPGELLLWGSIWLLGAAVALVAARARRLPPLALSLAFALPMLVYSRLSHTSAGLGNAAIGGTFPIDLGVGLAYALVLLSAHRWRARSRWRGLHHLLAESSFSLYVSHFPVLVFVAAAAAQWFGVPILAQPDVGRIALWATLVAWLMAVAWAFSRLFEARTHAVRLTLDRMLGTRGG